MKKEKDVIVDDVIDIDMEGMIIAAVNFMLILCTQILQSQNLASQWHLFLSYQRSRH